MQDEQGKRPPPGAGRPRVFTVPAGQPFLDRLAGAILKGDLPAVGGSPPSALDLPATTLLLPTRRATRALQEAFLRVGGGRAMLLPRVKPIAEGEEELSLIAAATTGGGDGDAADIPASIDAMQRRLALTSLVMRWSERLRETSTGADGDLKPFAASGAGTPAQAVHLADELAGLMDLVETEGRDFSALGTLVPEQYAEHWQTTLKFLDIVTSLWPHYLAEQGLIAPADRRNRVIAAEARRLGALPPSHPVIVAGITGSIPATVELMRAVATLPNGAIVLPALDQDLDEESWNAIVPAHPEHPQHGLKKLLDALGLTRANVAILPGAEPGESARKRHEFISEAMRPAATTGAWHAFATAARDAGTPAVSGMSLIETPSAQDEAETIAMILRQVLETPGRTAALVSPDRLLARRVAARLETWGIRVDDSAGRPFAKTVPGAFLDLLVSAVAKDFAPSELMALLKHPLTRLELDPFAKHRAARALEIAAFRRPYLGSGLAGVAAALEAAAREAKPDSGRRPHPAVRRLWDEDWNGARDLLTRIEAAVAPLASLFSGEATNTLAAFASAHRTAAEAVSALPPAGAEDSTRQTELWSGEAGAMAADFFAHLLSDGQPEVAISWRDYPDVYRALIAGENVRPRVPVHPRLYIWGPLESRLQQADVTILGSLNDGTWPEAADPGPWLSRPMRAALGLPSPEEAIGRSAHDFASLLGAPEVVMTRAAKIDGVPTVASRWLLRIQALLAGLGHESALTPPAPWLGWARHRDAVERVAALTPPEPRPDPALRPRTLSVSRVETWIANPYAIFAREILGLEPLMAIGQPPPASLRGSMIHEALSRFAKAHPRDLPKDIAGELLELARGVLDEHAAHPRIAAFWIPRFRRFAEWFAATEPRRRQSVTDTVAETNGKLVFAAPGGPFTLTARADRIDATSAGVVITDYKTGTVPRNAQVVDGASPQLPLEAAIAVADGFAHVPRLPVLGLRYIRASGGEPPGEERDVKTEDVDQLASGQLDGLKRLVARFDDAATPYRPTRRARFSYDWDDYAHLARVGEWSLTWDDGGEA